MDCGDFVKIGVSGNTEMRKMQIPYQVNQYYCTKKISNAFEIERKMHATFSKKRVSNAFGREYFSVPFAEAMKKLVEITSGKIESKEIEDPIDRLKIYLVGGDGFSETDRRIVEKLKDAIPKMSDFDKGYILGKVESMAEKKEKQEKKDGD